MQRLSAQCQKLMMIVKDALKGFPVALDIILHILYIQNWSVLHVDVGNLELLTKKEAVMLMANVFAIAIMRGKSVTYAKYKMLNLMIATLENVEMDFTGTQII